MAAALDHLPGAEKQRFTGQERLPVLVGSERLGTEDRHHIVGGGECREINLQRRIRQRGLAERRPAGEPVQPAGGGDKQPLAVADQGIEGAPLGQLGGAVVQLLKHRSRVAGIDPALIKPSVR